jgi:hypothetical protein
MELATTSWRTTPIRSPFSSMAVEIVNRPKYASNRLLSASQT